MPRPKGSLNRATREIREASRRLLADADYQASLRRRLIAGKAPHMETLLHHYAWGKPKDTTVHEGEDGQMPQVRYIVHHLMEEGPGRDHGDGQQPPSPTPRTG